jgi:hypothetical protein
VGGLEAGAGAGAGAAQEPAEEEGEARHSSGAAAYEELALDLAAVGAALFLYVLSAEPLGLSALTPLTTRSGGLLSFYSDVDECTMPEDVYKQLRTPFGSHGLLRLRTSPEIEISHSYGPMLHDASMEHLYHLAGATSDSSVAFGLGFAASAGFSDGGDHYDAPPRCVLQVAYSCTALVEIDPEEGEEGEEEGEEVQADAEAEAPVPAGDVMQAWGASGAEGGAVRAKRGVGRRFVRARLLRVHTVSTAVASTARALYDGVNDRVAMALLSHKVVFAVQAEGFREGRLLLQVRDRGLVMISASFTYDGGHFSAGLARSAAREVAARVRRPPRLPARARLAAAPAGLRASLGLRPAAGPASRGEHAALDAPHGRGPAHLAPRTLLEPPVWRPAHGRAPIPLGVPLGRGLRAARARPLVGRDAREWLLPLCALRPGTLMRLGGERRGGLRRAGALPQVLDALTVIYVYLGADWAETCPEGMQFPPGKQSALWRGVMQLKQERLHTPRIVACRAGEPAAALFEAHICEDEDEGRAQGGGGGGEGAAGGVGFSFGQFLEFCAREVDQMNGV